MINTEISEAIEAAMRETTFTEAALQTFKDALESIKTLEKQVSDQRKSIEGWEKGYKKEASKVTSLTEELEAVTKELGDLKKRESAIVSKETRTAVAEGKYTAFTHAMELVFKVPSTRREIQTSVGQPQYSDSNGYVQYPPSIHTDEIITETEE